jgi:hypothetical protein
MVRRTRRNRSQKGGGDWLGPKVAADKWIPHLTRIGLGGLITGQTAEEKMTAYITAVERQDELFLVCRDMILKEVAKQDIDDASKWLINHAADIEQNKQFIFDAITDALQWLTLIKSSKSGKWAALIDPAATDHRLLESLLYPGRMTNVFIQGLARVLVAFKQDPSSLIEIKNAEGQRRQMLIDLLTEQNVGYSNMYSYAMTMKGVEDGYAVTVPTILPDLKSFWNTLIAKIVGLYDVADIDLFKGEAGTYKLNTNNTITEIANIVASIYIYYKNDKINNIFENFGRGTTEASDEVTSKAGALEGFPPIDGLNVKLPALNNVPLKNLYKYMSLRMLSMMLHLRNTIRTVEQENSTPSAEPASSQGTSGSTE